MKVSKYKAVLFLGIFFFLACNSKPRVIEPDVASATTVSATSIPALEENRFLVADAPSKEHEIVVVEVLNTEKYSYLRVSEDGTDFWIAISKRDITLGDTYRYTGGLLKKNFFSREFNRVFETVYLVSNIWKKSDLNRNAGTEKSLNHGPHSGQALPNLEVKKIEPSAGAITLSKLFSNEVDYAGKVIKITGKCVKINPMIMNRNWLHIQDGSGAGLDLTVTTKEVVRLGEIVSLEGTIALDKDFGAGYRYDIIMEEAVLK